MKSALLFYLSTLCLVFFSCTKLVDDESFPFVELTHCANTEVNTNIVRICFDSLISESRCPANARCIWAGEAVGKFSFSANGQQTSFKLSTHLNGIVYPNEVLISGYKIKLLNISPYPGANQSGPVTAELSITQ